MNYPWAEPFAVLGLSHLGAHAGRTREPQEATGAFPSQAGLRIETSEVFRTLKLQNLQAPYPEAHSLLGIWYLGLALCREASLAQVSAPLPPLFPLL